MNLHKLYLQVFDLSSDDSYLIYDLMNYIREAKIEFEHVGVEFTHDSFKQWFERIYGPFNVPATANKPAHRDYNKMWKIITGDNLDIIEEAAKDRGLI
jgi:hypothetical protein